MIRFLLSTAFIFAFTFSITTAQERTVQGSVIDEQSGEPLPGVALRIASTNKGTYTGSKGTFKLRLPNSERTSIIVKCIGYESKEISVSPESSPMRILLKSAMLTTQEVVVSAPDVNGIIKRAIERKKQNREAIKTLKALAYSKLTTQAKGIGIQSGNASGNSFSLGGGIGAPEDSTAFIMETFSEMFFDYPNKKRSSTIIQRRQTKNINPTDNTLAFGQFMNLYDDEIKLFNLTFLSPLAEEPFGTYRYSLEDRQKIGDKFVYSIKVIPTSRLQPAFQGTIKIIDGNYNLIEADLRPSANTTIPLITDLHFIQKFEQIAPDIWHPTYLKSTGAGKGVAIKGFLELGISLEATTILTDVFLNVPIPDSVFTDKRVKVAKNADTINNEFWNNNALEELSEQEKKIYEVTQEESKTKDTIQGDQSEFEKITDFDIRIDFNRVSGVTTGVNMLMKKYDFAHVHINPAYSWALKKPIINVEARIFSDSTHKNYFFLAGYSQMQQSGHDRSISTFVNSIGSFILGNDYYDWFKQDGWAMGIHSEYFGLKGGLTFSESRQFSDTLKVKRSLFAGTNWRRNPNIDDGAFRTLEAGIVYGQVNPLQKNTWQASAEIKALYGEEYNRNESFRRVEISFQSLLPLINTGYEYMSLRVGANAGIADGTVPFQYRFRLQNTLTPIAPFGNMFSAPTGVYGGTELFHAQAEFNTTDLWWRALDLPLYEGRGIELIVAGGSALIAKNNTDLRYKTTQTQHYSEIGFGLGKIPVFFSNILFLRFDARWGIGPFAARQFGWGLGINFPF